MTMRQLLWTLLLLAATFACGNPPPGCVVQESYETNGDSTEWSQYKLVCDGRVVVDYVADAGEP